MVFVKTLSKTTVVLICAFVFRYRFGRRGRRFPIFRRRKGKRVYFITKIGRSPIPIRFYKGKIRVPRRYRILWKRVKLGVRSRNYNLRRLRKLRRLRRITRAMRRIRNKIKRHRRNRRKINRRKRKLRRIRLLRRQARRHKRRRRRKYKRLRRRRVKRRRRRRPNPAMRKTPIKLRFRKRWTPLYFSKPKQKYFFINKRKPVPLRFRKGVPIYRIHHRTTVVNVRRYVR